MAVLVRPIPGDDNFIFASVDWISEYHESEILFINVPLHLHRSKTMCYKMDW